MRLFHEINYYMTMLSGSHRLSVDGIRLAIQYYEDKYHTDICWTDIDFQEGNAFEKIRPYILAAKEKTGDYRQAYFCKHSSHAILLVYIREGEQEALFLSDSTSYAGSVEQSWIVRQLHTIDLPVYTTSTIRQTDTYSCYVDALIMARDMTRRVDTPTSDYAISHLLRYFKDHDVQPLCLNTSVNIPGGYVTLPHALLKTAQWPLFFNQHFNVSTRDEKIHKDETIETFRARYTTASGHMNYLKQKSKKLQGIIEIQFYINEISKYFNQREVLFTSEIKKEFIRQAKLAQINKQADSNASSLFSIAAQFVTQYIPEQPIPEQPIPEPITSETAVLSCCMQ